MPPIDWSLEYHILPFKLGKCLATRKREVIGMRTKFPTKLPVIVERYHRETYLPHLDKTKFLVPKDMTVGQFMAILRSRMPLSHAHTFYFLLGNRTLPTVSMNMSEVYAAHRDEDGFLYLTYASQEVFG
ncbi:microtubule-associated proteins 1A/1B light chain 3C-like isoform X1 [Ambystoma mexicanum]|uniref:microtubule-associated proteins 1A/1B light chain 3C-like isoform X1 n=1 Tax=Ambystoma mexicanum TaxID=8296 RepID=UPI0037E7A145